MLSRNIVFLMVTLALGVLCISISASAALTFTNREVPEILRYAAKDPTLFNRYFGHRAFKGSGRLQTIVGLPFMNVYSANVVSPQGEINCTPAIGPDMERMQRLSETYSVNQPILFQGYINGVAFGTLLVNRCRVLDLGDPTAIAEAAGHGDAQAQYQMGEIYSYGVGVPTDAKAGIDWYQRAASQGYAPAQAALAMLKGHQSLAEYKQEQDRVAAKAAQDEKRFAAYDTWPLERLQQAARNGDIDAEVSLGQRYLNGKSVPRDERRGIGYLMQAADKGSRRAAVVLHAAAAPGILFNGSAEAAFALGRLFQSGKGVPVDDGAALAWFRVAARQGHAGAKEQVKTYRLRQLEALREAARSGTAEDLLALAEYYLDPEYGASDGPAHALPLLVRAAGQGNARALSLLKAQATPGWIHNGNADAAYALGELYRVGAGVVPNSEQALRWYQVAADQGRLEAQARLAILERQRLDALHRAADRGNADAELELGIAYLRKWAGWD
jgi:TPR repeat protein